MVEGKRTQYALITGCTPGGIGHYLSLEFAERGFQVLGTVRDPAKYTSPHKNITYLPLEVTSNESIQELFKRVTEITGGKLDILYNNAGRNYVIPALDYDEDELMDLFQTNLFSVMKMCSTFIPLLVEAKGTIAQTGSIAGIMPYIWGAPYNASKAALHAYSDTLRVELAPLGVRVITVVTGGVISNIARNDRKLPLGSLMAPLAAEYERRLKHSQELGMNTRQYASSCVKQVIAGDGLLSKKRWIWEGKMSWLVWFAWTFLPTSVLDYYFTSQFNLNKLRGTVGPDKKDR
ncbi:DltE Short-chain dehydrogenase of various substrate specificities [Pyrenophora tritici-repentis]|uniref:DltE, Short-chain dehydrogenase n=1 Tax=Pyrenophora tritici-repentis TaxID=45151 RepID=A0A317AAQ2_9PLEO|nr:DltE Short-chain dehydrogenase [Pyrenophora tritici-repentis]KAF7448930.1 DltE Short-chain dehydrogenase [Pyrenophora tritici-repentis]KAF7571076.1 DltE, Short-chain dehydrogenase [Pyrenophora tritici-repentis]KAG9384131.1 DltE Short-chain dehydrogenase [Pyrenophora tritici-repentis]KAI0571364.1 DltE Short-chain dehydrogenase [Pyrenophora tritici-repentis]